LVGESLSHPLPVWHLPGCASDLDKHEPSHEGKRRNNRYNDPDKAASENGLEETSKEKEGRSGECGCDDLSPVNRGSVRNRDGCVVRELLGERGRVETAGEIVLGGIRPSAGEFSGAFNGGIDRYDWGGHEVQLDGDVNTWSSREWFHRSQLTLWKTG